MIYSSWVYMYNHMYIIISVKSMIQSQVATGTILHNDPVASYTCNVLDNITWYSMT